MTVSDPAEVSAVLERLRESSAALRKRPADEVLGSLARLFDAFADEESPAREALAAALPAVTGFSAETLREGLARGFAPWTGAALRSLVETQLGGVRALAGVRGFDVAAILLAGAIPMPALASIAAPLLLRTPVLAKPSRHDPVTAGIVHDTLRAIDAGLAHSLAILRFDGDEVDACTAALCTADIVEANGADGTIEAIRAHAGARPLIAHGHKFSVAAVGPWASDDVAERLALDIALWDQLGCLSPLAIYAVGGADPTDALVEALARAESRWPRGRTPLAAVAAAERERDQASMRGAFVQVGEGASFSVVRESDARPRPAPLHRFVRVHPVADAPALVEALRALQSHLACVALEGLGAPEGRTAEACAALGASRICAPGVMQAPPLDWRRGGHGVLEPWVRPEPTNA